MPLASAATLRSGAIGAGVGGKVSHRSAAKDGSAMEATNAARANWRMRLLRVRSRGAFRLFAFPPFMQARGHLARKDAPMARYDAGNGEHTQEHAQPVLHDRTFHPLDRRVC